MVYLHGGLVSPGQNSPVRKWWTSPWCGGVTVPEVCVPCQYALPFSSLLGRRFFPILMEIGQMTLGSRTCISTRRFKWTFLLAPLLRADLMGRFEGWEQLLQPWTEVAVVRSCITVRSTINEATNLIVPPGVQWALAILQVKPRPGCRRLWRGGLWGGNLPLTWTLKIYSLDLLTWNTQLDHPLNTLFWHLELPQILDLTLPLRPNLVKLLLNLTPVHRKLVLFSRKFLKLQPLTAKLPNQSLHLTHQHSLKTQKSFKLPDTTMISWHPLKFKVPPSSIVNTILNISTLLSQLLIWAKMSAAPGWKIISFTNLDLYEKYRKWTKPLSSSRLHPLSKYLSSSASKH